MSNYRIISDYYQNDIVSSEWIVSGDQDATMSQYQGSQVHPHPHNPAPGHSWNNQSVITFDKLKLTNNKHRADTNQVEEINI